VLGRFCDSRLSPADARNRADQVINATFVVRRRASATKSALSFPTGLPSREQLAMAAFHNRMQSAASLGFIGGFPNFQESVSGRDHLGGTILVRPAGGEFHDVPLAKLG